MGCLGRIFAAVFALGCGAGATGLLLRGDRAAALGFYLLAALTVATTALLRRWLPTKAPPRDPQLQPHCLLTDQRAIYRNPPLTGFRGSGRSFEFVPRPGVPIVIRDIYSPDGVARSDVAFYSEMPSFLIRGPVLRDFPALPAAEARRLAALLEEHYGLRRAEKTRAT